MQKSLCNDLVGYIVSLELSDGDKKEVVELALKKCVN